jgi:hypothetical protein
LFSSEHLFTSANCHVPMQAVCGGFKKDEVGSKYVLQDGPACE